MMKRREIVTLLIAASVMVPCAAHAQKAPAKVYRLGLLQPGAPPEPLVDALTERLNELGYREGNNIVYEYRWAEGKLNRLPELAKELVDLKVDVIATFSTPADGWQRHPNRKTSMAFHLESGLQSCRTSGEPRV
jgi:ABC-type uncharacterized transport system substrate-binding protein